MSVEPKKRRGPIGLLENLFKNEPAIMGLLLFVMLHWGLLGLQDLLAMLD